MLAVLPVKAAMRWLARVVAPALAVSPGTMWVFERHSASLAAVYRRTYSLVVAGEEIVGHGPVVGWGRGRWAA